MAAPSPNLLIVAGEPSGDLHGALVARELKNLRPELLIWGIGGEAMRREGVETIEDSSEMAVVGFSEVLRHYRFLRGVFHKLMDEIETRRPVRAVVIDYPGFNLRLARRLKGIGVPVTYYIPPQVWAWGEGRVKTIRDCFDQVLCIFPFEQEWYRARGVEAEFVGHPFLDRTSAPSSREDFLRARGIDSSSLVLGLFPGSRPQELDRHLSLFVAAFQRIRGKVTRAKGIVGLAAGLAPPRGLPEGVSVEADRPLEALRFSDVALLASGTITLEAALAGTPSVVAYRMSAVSGWLATRLSHAPFVAMPNLVAGKEIYPEFLQSRAQEEDIASAAIALLEDDGQREAVRKELRGVVKKLGMPGAPSRAAEKIAERL